VLLSIMNTESDSEYLKLVTRRLGTPAFLLLWQNCQFLLSSPPKPHCDLKITPIWGDCLRVDPEGPTAKSGADRLNLIDGNATHGCVPSFRQSDRLRVLRRC